MFFLFQHLMEGKYTLKGRAANFNGGKKAGYLLLDTKYLLIID